MCKERLKGTKCVASFKKSHSSWVAGAQNIYIQVILPFLATPLGDCTFTQMLLYCIFRILWNCRPRPFLSNVWKLTLESHGHPPWSKCILFFTFTLIRSAQHPPPLQTVVPASQTQVPGLEVSFEPWSVGHAVVPTKPDHQGHHIQTAKAKCPKFCFNTLNS